MSRFADDVRTLEERGVDPALVDELRHADSRESAPLARSLAAMPREQIAAITRAGARLRAMATRDT